MRLSRWFLIAALPLAASCDEEDGGLGIGDDGDRYTASLSGAAVRPAPVTSAASGSATFVVRQPSIGSSQRTVGYTIDLTGITDPRAVHIHLGGASIADGQVLATLYTNPTDTATISGRLVSGVLGEGTAALSIPLDSLGVLMRSGNAYVDVHTRARPDGALRGQIVRPGADVPGDRFAAPSMTGAAQRPTPNTSTVTGAATFEVVAGSLMRYTVRVTGANEVTAAHLHIGEPSEAGPIVVTLFTSATPTGPISGTLASGSFTVANIQAALTFEGLIALMASESMYVDVHSADFINGEIRGQIEPVTVFPF
jgi:hypothetical protein